jgi:MFS superfamily sulfate permease-like transporter
MNKRTDIFSNFRSDVASGLVVFLVAVPLCLGIALASGAPLFSGIIAGIVGGIIIGTISRSHVSVSGPAAGLTAIVLSAINGLGAFDLFLCAVVIAGLIQLALGFLRAGSISNYFPSNVIEGMLSAIGIIIILKQLPHAVGYDKNNEGIESFIEPAGNNTFSSILNALNYLHPGALLITVLSILIMLAWNKYPVHKKIKIIPGALVAVIVGVLLNELFIFNGSRLAIGKQHLVNLPVPGSLQEFAAQLTLPDLHGFLNWKVWISGFTIAIVASIESLLCIEATDKLDPWKRYTSTDHELKAQGIGNIVSGLLGGLPTTSVIVRSTANINAGARSKLSTIIHGILLLICAIAIPAVLNRIPLATLAAILILTGYKLCNPGVFKKMWQNGKYQFIPFAVTVIAVVFTDLLKGVALGLVVSIIAILRVNLKTPYFFKRSEYHDGDNIYIRLAEEVSFLNKAAIKLTLEHLPRNSQVTIDAAASVYIDHDVMQVIREFTTIKAPERDIRVKLAGFKEAYRIIGDGNSNHVTIEHQRHALEPAADQKDHTELINQLTNKN